MTQPTASVSVALCTYNGERYIAEQLASILDQPVPATQLVVSDDGSTDATLDIIEKAMKSRRAAGGGPVPTVKILRNPTPLGVVRNFEQALKHCTGDLVALCDQDDRWQRDRLEIVGSMFEKDPGLLLVNSDARLVDGDGKPLGYSLFSAIGLSGAERRLIHKGDGFTVLLRRNPVTGATTVFRRELLERALPFPDSWVHDEWLAAMAAVFGRFDSIDRELIDYRQHGDNVIGAARITWATRFSRLREPRVDRNRRLLERAEALESRLAENNANARFLELARAKLEHERVRSALPARRISRLAPVLREFRGDGYSRFGRGAQDVLRDMVQPAR